MKAVVEWCAYLVVRGVFGAMYLLPHVVRVYLCGGLFCVVFLLLPRLRGTAMTNFRIAFPDRSQSWYWRLLLRNGLEMGRLLADVVRLPSLDAEWARQHVSMPALGEFAAAHRDRGLLAATGHLGSFELLGHVIGLLGCPVAAVARPFKSAKLNAWWTSLREAGGNTIIERTGAFRAMMKALSSGTSVAVLFDQNVKSNHAEFVDWFGMPAATTRAFAVTALKTRAPVFVISIRYEGRDQYRIDAVPCDFSKLYVDAEIADDEKIRLITQEVSDRYCQMIREFPEGWFWIHRRWKTRPPGEQESVY